MQSHIPARSQLLVTLLFAVPLAALGFQVASWWGVPAGLLVGAVMTARLLMRGAMQAPSATVIFAASSADRSREVVTRERPLLH